MSSSLIGRTALITGSTSGIGLGIARSFAHSGSNIMLNGFGSPQEISDLCTSFKNEFPHIKVAYHGADMSSADEIKELIHETNTVFGSLDVLINNAGIQHTAPVETFSSEMWDKIMAINLSSNFHTIRHSLPLMKTQEWGRIINISSVHGKVGSVNKSAYVAAKHGVLGLTKVIGLETAREANITCNAVCPGWVRTPLVEAQIEARAKDQDCSIQEATENLLAEKQPSLEFVLPSDLGDMCIFLCSEGARQMTGQSLVIDGGWSSQ